MITLAYGDGVGPEIMEAALFVLREAGAELEIETIEIGERIYNMGAAAGLLPSAYESLKRTRVLIKGPVMVPEHEYFRDVTAVLREEFGLEQEPRLIEQCDLRDIFPHETPEIIATGTIGEALALFEPVQEALPELKGKQNANPSAMILAAAMMLRHIGQPDRADAIRQALQETLKAGIHTPDIYRRRISNEKITTQEFAEAVVSRLVKNRLLRSA